jgi:hypothetical protein
MALSEQELGVLAQIGNELTSIFRGYFVGTNGFVSTWVSEGGAVGIAVDGSKRFEAFSQSAKPTMQHPVNLLYTWSEADWRKLVEAKAKDRERMLETLKLHIGAHILMAAHRPDVNLNDGSQATAGQITVVLNGFGNTVGA